MNKLRLSELRRGPLRGISQLAELNGYRFSTERSLGRKFIDEHGLVQGLYNVYLNPAKASDFQCEVPDCREILQEYYLRIMAVMDQDGEWYTLNSLAKEPAVYEALINTNRRAIICLEHRAPAVLVAGEQPTVRKAPLIQIARGKGIKQARFLKPL